MKAEKILEVAAQYRQLFYDRNILSIQAPKGAFGPGQRTQMQHARWMIEQIPGFIEEGRTDKAMRWLCFVQGILWCQAEFSIANLGEHNRAEGS